MATINVMMIVCIAKKKDADVKKADVRSIPGLKTRLLPYFTINLH